MNVPTSPKASEMVPVAAEVPTTRVPVVVTLPLGETVRPTAPAVIA